MGPMIHASNFSRARFAALIGGATIGAIEGSKRSWSHNGEMAEWLEGARLERV